MEEVLKKRREKDKATLRRTLQQNKIIQVNKMGQMVFRVGGGYIQFEEFLEKYGLTFLMDLHHNGALTSITSIKKAHSAKTYVLSHQMSSSQRIRQQTTKVSRFSTKDKVDQIKSDTKNALDLQARKFRTKESILLDYTNRPRT